MILTSYSHPTLDKSPIIITVAPACWATPYSSWRLSRAEASSWTWDNPGGEASPIDGVTDLPVGGASGHSQVELGAGGVLQLHQLQTDKVIVLLNMIIVLWL